MKIQYIDLAIYFSAIALSVSVFLPLTTLPVIGDVTYHRVADVESYLVIACCALAPALLLINKARLVIISAMGVWLTLLSPALRQLLRSEDRGFVSDALNRTTGAMQEFAADLFFDIADFSWGGFVLLTALLLFTLSCLIRVFR